MPKPSVELVAVQNIKDTEQTVYDLKLTGAVVSSFENDPGPSGVETSLAFNYAILGTPETFAFDLNELKIDAAVSSDVASQINQMAMGLASFMASSQLGASSSQDLVSTQSTQQDNHLPTGGAARVRSTTATARRLRRRENGTRENPFRMR